MKRILICLFGIAMLSISPSILFGQISEEEKADGFVSIFNGKDLSEWEGSPDLWRAENGSIVGQTGTEGPTLLTYNQFLIWKGGDVDNFVLRFDIKLSPKGNSGMQYRSWMNTDASKPYSVSGYQADFDGMHTYSGILYGEGFGGILCKRGEETIVEKNRKSRQVRVFAENEALKKEIKVDDWNSYEITAKDFTFTNKINGHVVSICTDDDKETRREKGIIAIQAHKGPAMKVEVKNIRIKKLGGK